MRAGKSLRSVGWVSLLLGLLSACGRVEVVPGGTASGGVAAVGGGTGGTLSSGGAGGAGGAAAGTGGSLLGSGGTMTEAEWQAARAPLVGPHEVWTYDGCQEPYVGSESVRVGPEYSVVPTFEYVHAADSVEPNLVFDLVPVPYCVTSADCTEQPGGVCQGRLADAFCYYPEPLPPEDCTVDADCTKKKSDATCVPPIGYEEYRVCYPTGVCKEPSSTCAYAGDLPCTADTDCNEGADGKCILPVEATTCRYDTCFEHDDCGLGDGCGCGECLPAGCTADNDCPDAETCELSPGWCFGGVDGFHCSTSLDQCTAGEPGCIYQPEDPGYWSTAHCLK